MSPLFALSPLFAPLFARSRRSGPQVIGEILLVVLAKLGVGQVQSEIEAPSPDADASDTGSA